MKKSDVFALSIFREQLRASVYGR